MITSLRRFISVFFKSLLKNKNLSTYAVFFFISFAFWFLNILSKTHETTFFLPVKYVNYPADLIEVITPANFIHVRVKAAGISIISFHLFNYNSLKLDFNLANHQPIDNGQNLFWIMNSKRKEVARALGSSIEIMDITPQRMSVSFANMTKKEVKVLLNSDIKLRPEFWLANDIEIVPSSVIIYGEQGLLDTISGITTDLLKLYNLYESQVIMVSLIFPNGLKCNTNSVSVKLNIEPFVEEVIKQEVEIRNIDKGYSLKLFPRFVSVTLRVPKDKYQLFETDFLNLYIDASEIRDQKIISIKYDDLPDGVRMERIFPNRLEFLLIKD